MKSRKILIGVTVTLVLMLAAYVGAFYATGGYQLVTLYTQYLSQDIPDKKYSYEDFTDRGPREVLRGYYAGNVGNNIFVWTYSGLKRFTHKPITSVYYHVDTCGVIVEIAARRETSDEVGGSTSYTESITFELTEWVEQMKLGDYVWVKRVGEGRESKVIDKVWGDNNSRYPYGGAILSECRAR